MSESNKNEDTPFVIDMKRGMNPNYGSAETPPNPTTFAQSSTSTPLSLRGALEQTLSTWELRNRTPLIGINNNATLTPPLMFCIHGRDNVEVRDHCHRPRSEGIDVKARRKLIIASILCLCFMTCEIIGGVLSNSLAIATDAAHLLTDFAGFMISLLAIWLAGRPSTQRMSFGWYRAEIIGALASVVLIWFITAILVWLAIERLISQDFELDAKVMLITSGLAIVINIIMGVQLQHGHTHGMGLGGGHGHSHGGKKDKKKKKAQKNVEPEVPLPEITNPTSLAATPKPNTDSNGAAGFASDAEASAGSQPYSYQNSSHNETPNREPQPAQQIPKAHHKKEEEIVNMNVRAAFIHVLGDVVQSIGVFIAALIIYFRPEWALADPICTFIFSIIVLVTTFSILKDAILVLMEGTPGYMHYTEVMETFKQIDGVERVHNLRIWALSVNKVALAAHLVIRVNADPKKILEEANCLVHQRYNFFETTIQIEEYSTSMENCSQCEVPPS